MKSPKVFFFALACAFLLLKLSMAVAYIPAGQTIFQLDFGFGEYIQSLHTNGRLEFCRKMYCSHSTRMPLIPWLYSLLGYISDKSVVVAVLKNALMSGLVVLVFAHLLRHQQTLHRQARQIWCWILPVLVLSPAVIKHASAITYEEGLLIELGALWSLAFLLSLRMLAEDGPQAQAGPSVLSVLLAAVIYMTKSSMLPLLFIAMAAALWTVVRRRHLPTLVAVLGAAAMVVGWGVRNEHVTGRFSIMTSWDGENMFRGASDMGYRIYPDVMLDRIFDADSFHMRDGQVIHNVPQPSIGGFKDEWAWNDHYRALAVQWVTDHPRQALAYTGHKLLNFFVSIEKTPYQYKSDGSEIKQRFSGQNILTAAWLLVGRCMELWMLALLAWHGLNARRSSLLLCGGVVLVNAAYAAPYVLGFNYERHITPYLVLVAVCVAVLWAQRQETLASLKDMKGSR